MLIISFDGCSACKSITLSTSLSHVRIHSFSASYNAVLPWKIRETQEMNYIMFKSSEARGLGFSPDRLQVENEGDVIVFISREKFPSPLQVLQAGGVKIFKQEIEILRLAGRLLSPISPVVGWSSLTVRLRRKTSDRHLVEDCMPSTYHPNTLILPMFLCLR